MNMSKVEGITPKSRYYNADVDNKFKNEINDVNKYWADCNLIITNNVITCGVNYDLEGFYSTYLFVANHNSMRDIIQVSCRVRSLLSKTVYVSFLGRMTRKQIWDDDTENIMCNCPIYKTLFNNVHNEEQSPIKESLREFFRIGNYNQEIDDAEAKHTATTEFNELMNTDDYQVYYRDIECITDTDAKIIKISMCNHTNTKLTDE